MSRILPSLSCMCSHLETPMCQPLHNRKLIFFLRWGVEMHWLTSLGPTSFHSDWSPGPPGASEKDSRCLPDFRLSWRGECVCPCQLLRSGLSCGSGSSLYTYSTWEHNTVNESILFPTCCRGTTHLSALSEKYEWAKRTYWSSQSFTEWKIRHIKKKKTQPKFQASTGSWSETSRKTSDPLNTGGTTQTRCFKNVFNCTHPRFFQRENLPWERAALQQTSTDGAGGVCHAPCWAGTNHWVLLPRFLNRWRATPEPCQTLHILQPGLVTTATMWNNIVMCQMQCTT